MDNFLKLPWIIIFFIIFFISLISIIYFTPISITKLFKLFTSNWLFVLIFIYILNFGLIMYFDPYTILSNYTKTFISLLIITGILNILIWKYLKLGSIKDSDGIIKKLYNTLKIIIIVYLLYSLLFAIYYYVIFTPLPLTIFIILLNILIIAGGIALVYTYIRKKKPSISDKSSKFGLILKLIYNLILYVPCLFIDFIEFIKYNYNITTKTVWIILLIELLLVGLRLIIPYLYKKLMTVDGIIVEKGPIYLNVETNLGNFQNIIPSISTKEEEFNYNYAISTWLWINPQPSSTNSAYNNPTLLLNYGNILDIIFNKNKLEFWAATTDKNNTKLNTNTKKKIFVLKNIPYQKWNNIIFNYDSGTLDIFINNKLVSSTINITPILYHSIISSGENNGINGGIKNLIYYDKILSKNDIYSIYTTG